MTGEVLSHGDDERRSGAGRPLGVVVAIALLGIVGVAVGRSRSQPEAKPSPSPTAFTEYPSEAPIDDGAALEPEEDPFADYVTVARPPDGAVRAVLLPTGLPGFLVPDAGAPLAIEAIGGPSHAQVLLGWCAGSKTFQDAEGTVFYDATGAPLRAEYALERHAVRESGGDPGRLDIGGRGGVGVMHQPGRPPAPGRCRAPLLPPKLPPRGESVHDTVNGYRVLRGRYIATTVSRAFCDVLTRTGCASRGWEEYYLRSLPPGDLAGSYTWEGDFVVRGDSEGNLVVARLPGARLVARERVGVTARVGVAHGVDEGAGGALTLRFNPFRHRSGTPPDDSPPGPPEDNPDTSYLMTDIEGGDRRYPMLAKAEVHLGDGVTGLGQPAGTPDTLRDWLRDEAHFQEALWIVLDAQGRVIRVVADG